MYVAIEKSHMDSRLILDHLLFSNKQTKIYSGVGALFIKFTFSIDAGAAAATVSEKIEEKD